MRKNPSKFQHQFARRGLVARFRHVFRQRQIYLRSEGEVQFITLRPRTQIITLILLVCGLFWVAFATVNVGFKDQLLVRKEKKLYQAQLGYESRLREMRTRIDRLNQRLMLDQNGYLDEIDKVRAEYRGLFERHRALQTFLRQGWLPVKQTPDSDDQSSLEPEIDWDSAAAAPVTEGNWTYKEVFKKEFRSIGDAYQPLIDLRKRFGHLKGHQVALVGEAQQMLDKKLHRGKKIYSQLGLDAEKVIAASDFEPGAVGGPFIEATAAQQGEPLSEALTAAAEKISHLEILQHEAARLPLAKPVERLERVSSGFGMRRDPLRKRQAFHAGLDIISKYGTAVLATAPGVVTKAGWKGAYGKTVEIEHRNGLITRYAHLRSVSVKVGQKIRLGEKVGRLGNTGRSTGAHLHYETRLRGDAVNPRKFWKANDDFQTLKQ